MDNITYFNEIAQQETGGDIPQIAQDGMTEDFHEWKETLRKYIALSDLVESERDMLHSLIEKVTAEARKSGFIQGFLTGNQ